MLARVSRHREGLVVERDVADDGMAQVFRRASAGELAEFGIRVDLIEPGYLQTDFLASNSLALPARTVDGYTAIRGMTSAHQSMPCIQLGDPVKAASAIITVATSPEAP